MDRGKERREATTHLAAVVRAYLGSEEIIKEADKPPLREAYEQWASTHEHKPGDENLWRCPHCDAERPGFGWQLNSGSYADYDLHVLTCFCGECRTLLSVNVVGFLPESMRNELLKRSFPGGIKA